MLTEIRYHRHGLRNTKTDFVVEVVVDTVGFYLFEGRLVCIRKGHDRRYLDTKVLSMNALFPDHGDPKEKLGKTDLEKTLRVWLCTELYPMVMRELDI